MFKYLDGQKDEDHLIAAIWNLCGLAWTEEKRPEMMDIPAVMGAKLYIGMNNYSNYDPKYCDGHYCCRDCDICPIARKMEEETDK